MAEMDKMKNYEYIEPCSEADLTNVLHPLVKEWFFSKFKAFSLTQLYGVLSIHSRKNILISAPTGGTKTLTAFLAILNYLVSLAERKELENKIYAVYVSPLKALSNDIFVNLERPLEEIYGIAEKKGIKLQEIRVGLRTGDTTASARAKMARKIPHILVTTPESLAIILVAPKFGANLGALEFIIVDEIHAMANKRGVHLSITLERLSEVSLIEPVRVGLSATISPLEEIAGFLVGSERDCVIADVKMIKGMDLSLLYPTTDLLEAESPAQAKRLYHLLDELIQEHKTTLIFTNTRNATERIIHYLDLHFPGKYTGLIGAHHGSISKATRLNIEERLRSGELKVVVTSTSLELGIDIGSIDLVVLLRSPKGVARALQRIGRAGHKLHSEPKGRFVVMDRDDLVECSILMKHMIEKKIDRAHIPVNALDVLAQQIFGMVISRVWNIDQILKLVRKSYCYRNLSKEDFYSVISYLAGDYALEERSVYAKIWYDAKSGEVGKRGKLARIIYMTNIGTIAEEGYIDVVVGKESVGSIDEGFLERLHRGDVFVLGGMKYQFLFSRGMKAYVRSEVSKSPTVPSWFSEQLPLSYDVAIAIVKLRGLIKDRIGNKKECCEFLRGYLYCDEKASEMIYDYCKEQDRFSELPGEKTLLIEKFRGEKEYLIFHTLYGRRVNDALSRAYGFIAAQLKHRDVEIGINDNGFFIAGEKLDENKILAGLNSKNIDSIISEAIEKSDILKRRFRHCAARSLMILLSYRGRSKSVGKQQVHSGFLLATVKKLSGEFPILREARREILEDLMDIEKARAVVRKIENGELKIKKINTPLVSPFGLTLATQSHGDFINVEERVKFLKRMHELQIGIIAGKGE